MYFKLQASVICTYFFGVTLNLLFILNYIGLPWWLSWSRICLQCRRRGFDLWVGKIPWRKEWLPTPVFLPGGFLKLYYNINIR